MTPSHPAGRTFITTRKRGGMYLLDMRYLEYGQHGDGPYAAVNWRPPSGVCLVAISSAIAEIFRVSGESVAAPQFYLPEGDDTVRGFLLSDCATLTDTHENGLWRAIMGQESAARPTKAGPLARWFGGGAVNANGQPSWLRPPCHPGLRAGWDPNLPPTVAFDVALSETFPADPLNKILASLYELGVTPQLHEVSGGILIAPQGNLAAMQIDHLYHQTMRSNDTAPWGPDNIWSVEP